MSEKVKKPFFKKWWFWVIVVVIALGAIGSGGSGDDKKTADTSGKPAASDTAKKDDKKEEEKVYNVGDSVTAGKISVVINKVSEQKEFKSGNQFIKNVTTEGKFIVVEGKITNNDSDARTIDTNMFKLVDDKKREFEVYSKAELMMILGDKYLFLESVNPGMSRTGTFVFEVPADVATYSLKVYPGVGFKTGTPQTVKLK